MKILREFCSNARTTERRRGKISHKIYRWVFELPLNHFLKRVEYLKLLAGTVSTPHNLSRALQPGKLRPQLYSLRIQRCQLLPVKIRAFTLGDCPERPHGRRVYFGKPGLNFRPALLGQFFRRGRRGRVRPAVRQRAIVLDGMRLAVQPALLALVILYLLPGCTLYIIQE
jgi:hypothetical protein